MPAVKAENASIAAGNPDTQLPLASTANTCEPLFPLTQETPFDSSEDKSALI